MLYLSPPLTRFYLRYLPCFFAFLETYFGCFAPPESSVTPKLRVLRCRKHCRVQNAYYLFSTSATLFRTVTITKNIDFMLPRHRSHTFVLPAVKHNYSIFNYDNFRKLLNIMLITRLKIKLLNRSSFIDKNVKIVHASDKFTVAYCIEHEKKILIESALCISCEARHGQKHLRAKEALGVGIKTKDIPTDRETWNGVGKQNLYGLRHGMANRSVLIWDDLVHGLAHSWNSLYICYGSVAFHCSV